MLVTGSANGIKAEQETDLKMYDESGVLETFVESGSIRRE